MVVEVVFFVFRFVDITLKVGWVGLVWVVGWLVWWFVCLFLFSIDWFLFITGCLVW